MKTAVWIGIVIAVLFIGDFMLNHGRGHRSIQQGIAKALVRIVD